MTNENDTLFLFDTPVKNMCPHGRDRTKCPFCLEYTGTPFVHHSQTSQDASKIPAPTLQSRRKDVLEAIAKFPNGLTDLEISEVTGIDGSSARPRRVELLEDGLIESAGTRKARSGRQATVWILKGAPKPESVTVERWW